MRPGLPLPLGAPPAFLYGAALVFRNAFAEEPEKASVPVICIGNLTVGGTGKTPAVAWAVEALRKAGRRPGILSRGYGRDETILLARLCPETPVVEEADRVKGAKAGVASGADVLVMDDGFQHLRLARDLDLVLLDATDPWGGGHLLPWGRLREPVQALKRAGAAMITRCDLVSPEDVKAIREEALRLNPQLILAEAVHEPVGGEDLKGKKVIAACGIGNPEAFQKTLERLGASVTLRAYPDHHRWTESDVSKVNAEAGGDLVVTTEKDGVKLEAIEGAKGWKRLGIRLRVTAGEGEILEAMRLLGTSK